MVEKYIFYVTSTDHFQIACKMLTKKENSNMVPFRMPEKEHSNTKCDLIDTMALKVAEKSEAAVKAGIPHAALELFFIQHFTSHLLL